MALWNHLMHNIGYTFVDIHSVSAIITSVMLHSEDREEHPYLNVSMICKIYVQNNTLKFDTL